MTGAPVDTALPRLSSPTLHCPDARELARFYAELTGGKVTLAMPEWAVMDGPGGRIDFQTVSDYRPSTWPGGDAPLRSHLDFYVHDLAEGERHALVCGARREDDQPNAEHCLVFRDPVGHVFCLTTWEDIGG